MNTSSPWKKGEWTSMQITSIGYSSLSVCLTQSLYNTLCIRWLVSFLLVKCVCVAVLAVFCLCFVGYTLYCTLFARVSDAVIVVIHTDTVSQQGQSLQCFE